MSNVSEGAPPRAPTTGTTNGRFHRTDLRSLREILVCVDRSSYSDVCVKHAVTIARCLGGSITVLYVMSGARDHAGQATDAVEWEIARQETEAYLGELQASVRRASTGGGVATRIEQGHPADRISAVARELDADLIILGGRGERPSADGALGSTAQQVLASSYSSVLVVMPDTIGADIAPKRILVPLDGSPRSEAVLPAAFRIASEHGAELLLVFVVREPLATGVLFEAGDLAVARDLASRLEVSATRYLAGLRERLVRDGVAARARVVRSPEERLAILDVSREEASDLVVLSAHGATCNPEVRCGSVTASLLAHSRVPVLVLQDLRADETPSVVRGRSAPVPRAVCAEEA